MHGHLRILATGLTTALLVAGLGCNKRQASPLASPTPTSTITEREPDQPRGPAYVALAVSDRYGCALRRDGAVACWGDDPAGRIGMRPTTSRWTLASQIADLPRVRSLAATEQETCVALEADGSVRCWGEDPMRTIAALLDAVELEAAGSTLCARTGAGEVHCWSPGDTEPERTTHAAIDLAVGEHSACALDADGDVWCWPDDLRIVGAKTRLAAQQVATVPDAVEVFASSSVCVRSEAGEVRCGSLVDSPPGTGYRPTPVADLERATAYARKHGHGCALLGDGTVRCHGENGWAQLGDGSSTTRDPNLHKPSTVPLDRVANAIAVSHRLSCALTDDHAQCWGTRQTQPQTLDEFERHVVVRDAIAVVSNFDFSCASNAEGVPTCWGPLGPGYFTADPGGILAAATPAPLRLDIGPVTQLSNGCLLGQSGALRCGELVSMGRARETVGAGEFAVDFAAQDVEAAAGGGVPCLVRHGRISCQNRRANTPAVEVAGLRRVTSVQPLPASYYDYCAVHAGGRISCFHVRADHRTSVVGAPVEVALPDPVQSTFTRRDEACAVTKPGEVWCWRFEDDAGVVLGLTQLDLPPARDAVSFADHTCVSTTEGRVACVRDSSESAHATVQWLELEDIVELVGDTDHMCTRDAGGTVTCIGRNDVGQLGARPAGVMVEPTRIDLPL